MMARNTGRLEWVEACRAAAALLVVVYHANRLFVKAGGTEPLGRLVHFGHAGVDLFFVISGFIILHVHRNDIGQPAALARYVSRRVTRLFPIYWVALLARIVLAAVAGHAVGAGRILEELVPYPTDADRLIGVAWSLEYELVFYLLFGVLILHRWVGWAVFGAWFLLVVGAAVSGAALAVPQAWYFVYDLEFFLGMAVAWAVGRWPVRDAGWLAALGIVGFVATGLAEDWDWLDGYGPWARVAYGVSGAGIVMGAALAARVRPWAWIRQLGGASYSIYLFHLPIITMVWQIWSRAGAAAPVLGCLGSVVVAVLVSVGISRMVEYPLMRMARRLLSRPRALAAAD
jgi:peptidoglycan/LPS O-acetylase OafA/YrhL